MERWWLRMRHSVRTLIVPLIILQFLRTLLVPTGFDIFILLVLFLIHLGFALDVY